MVRLEFCVGVNSKYTNNYILCSNLKLAITGRSAGQTWSFFSGSGKQLNALVICQVVQQF